MLFRKIWGRLACTSPQPLGEFREHIYEKSGTLPLAKVTVRMDSVAKAGGNFIPDRDLTFTFNGTPAALFSSQNADLRSIPENQQATIQGVFADLDSGEYAMTLRFVASNADSDSGKVGLTVLVRDEPWIPLLVIVLGVLTSFFTKKIFAVTRDRLTLKARISQLDSAWLRSEPTTSAIVWAQANLRLTRGLARLSWLTIPDLVNTKLADIEALLPTLRTIRDTRKLLESRVTNALARTRALGKLAQQAARCSDPPLSPAALQEIGKELETIQQRWGSSGALSGALWTDRLESIRLLLKEVQPDYLKDAAKDVVTALRDSLQMALGGAPPVPVAVSGQAAAPALAGASLGPAALAAVSAVLDAAAGPPGAVSTLPAAAQPGAAPNVPDDVFGLYAQYAALELLWERRNAPELSDLVASYEAHRSVQELFKIADDASWRRLMAAKEKKQIRLLAPTVPQQAFDPFALRVTTGDADLDGSFFFKFRLRFEWRIELRAWEWWKPRAGESQYAALTPETLEPTVVQYARRAGTGVATVRIWYGTSAFIDVDEPVTIKIERSDIKRIVNAQERAEFWPLVLAAGVAVITGFVTQYSGNNTFGSTKDYLALFLTGSAVDWLKNTVQPTTSTPQITPAKT
jgi:hypothetical protein